MNVAAAPRRGLSCDEAAAYVGVGKSKFLLMVDEGKMPKPIRFDRRIIWDIRTLDAAFDLIGEQQSSVAVDEPVDDVWGDDAP